METRPDLHEWSAEIDDGHLYLHVTCPYDLADTLRPCWPYDFDGTPQAAPQELCTYESWVENLTADEIIHGNVVLPLVGARVEWPGDSMIVRVG